MLPFGVTIPATAPQKSEIPDGLMNYPVNGSTEYSCDYTQQHKYKSKIIALSLHRLFFTFDSHILNHI
jgi:hypothetical protein